jgi:hypothetical protein
MEHIFTVSYDLPSGVRSLAPLEEAVVNALGKQPANVTVVDEKVEVPGEQERALLEDSAEPLMRATGNRRRELKFVCADNAELERVRRNALSTSLPVEAVVAGLAPEVPKIREPRPTRRRGAGR